MIHITIEHKSAGNRTFARASCVCVCVCVLVCVGGGDISSVWISPVLSDCRPPSKSTIPLAGTSCGEPL